MKSLILLFFLLPLSFANITQMTMTGSVDTSGTTHLAILTNYANSSGQQVFLNITGPIDSVVVKDKSGLILPTNVVPGNGYTLIYAMVPVDYLEYEIVSDSFTSKNDTSWDLGMTIGDSQYINSFNSSIGLPNGVTLKSTNAAVQQNANALTLLWQGSNIDIYHRIGLKASYDEGYETAGLNLTIIIAIIVILVILVLFFFLKRRAQKTQLSAQPSVPQAPQSALHESLLESNNVFKTLDETDKEIIREISAQNGKTTQAHIYTHTHVPKATLSRRLASLENRGIIRKSQKGNRNLITLTDIIQK